MHPAHQIATRLYHELVAVITEPSRDRDANSWPLVRGTLGIAMHHHHAIIQPYFTLTETGLPESNVLYFELENNSWCCARPSGTEPKIQFYMGIKGDSLEDADGKLAELKEAVIANIK